MTTAATIYAKLGLDTSQFDGALAGASAKATAMGSGFGAVTASMQSAGKLAFMGLVAGSVAGVAAVGAVSVALTKFAVEAGKYASIADSFDSMTQEMGISAEELEQKVFDASGGTIDRLTTLQGATRALSLMGKGAFTDFGEQFSSMAELSKKAARATGMDVNYMFDSLILGMSRESKLILDNLGINVDLVKAKQEYADSIGKTVEQLTLEEEKAAVLNHTLATLENTYGEVAVTSGGLQGALQQAKVWWTNLRLELGEKMLPVVNSVTRVLMKIAGVIGNKFSEGLSVVLPYVERFVNGLISIGETIADAGVFSMEFAEALTMLFPDKTADEMWEIIQGVETFINKVKEVLAPIGEWIANNIELKDVLATVGILIASWLVPTLISFVGTIISALAPVVAAFLGVLAVVVLLRKAWETDFLGMRTAITEAWTNTILPALQQLWQWLQVNVPLAIETLKTYWTEVLLPAILEVWAWIQTNLLPVLQELWSFLGDVLVVAIQGLVWYWNNLVTGMTAVWTFIQEKIVPIFKEIASVAGVILGAALSAVTSIWENVLLPAINAVWQFIQDNVMPIFNALAELFDVALTLALTALAGLWENVLQPALESVWEWVKDKVIPIFEALKEFWDTKFGPIIETVADWLGEKLQPAFDGISNVVSAIVGWIETLTEKLKNIKLPDWLTPGSPTPFEIGLWGVLDALKAVNKEGFLDSFQDSIKSPDLSVDREVGGTGQTNNYYLTANYPMQSEMDLAQQIRVLETLHA